MESETAGLSFEDAVVRLEEIVSAMESGSLPLDDCLAQFERAVALSRHCAAKLETAERQIRLLSADGALGTPAELPWADDVAAGSG